MKNLVHESWKGKGRDEDIFFFLKAKWNPKQCDLIFLHVIVELLPIDGDLKGYLSGRSTRTFHTPPSYGAVHEEGTQQVMTEHCWGFHSIEHHIPSFKHSNEFRHYKVISIFSSAQKHNRVRATWEISDTYHFSLCHFLLFYAVMHFSPGEFSTSKSLHIIHWHQRGREWDCASVWCSPRIAVCNRNLMCRIETEQCHRWLKTRLLKMNGGERVQCAHTHVDRQKCHFIWHSFKASYTG